jgi:hypothetical protein
MMLARKPASMTLIARRLDTGLPIGLLLNPENPVSAYTYTSVLHHAATLYLKWIDEARRRNTLDTVEAKLNEAAQYWKQFL